MERSNDSITRALRYLTLNFFDGVRLRQISMLGTTGAILSLSVWLLVHYGGNAHGL